jgi:hypothetical protein
MKILQTGQVFVPPPRHLRHKNKRIAGGADFVSDGASTPEAIARSADGPRFVVTRQSPSVFFN